MRGVAGSREVIEKLLRDCVLPKQVYAVSGNHDMWTHNFKGFAQKLEQQYPITFLENKSVPITKGGDTVYLLWNQRPEHMGGRESTAIRGLG